MTDAADKPVALPARQPTLRVMPTPADLNANGDIFGGWIMAQTDIAGGIAAMHRARGRVTTVAVNSFVFKQPISVGDIVSLYAEVVDTGRTSMKVAVEVLCRAASGAAADRQGDRSDADLCCNKPTGAEASAPQRRRIRAFTASAT